MTTGKTTRKASRMTAVCGARATRFVAALAFVTGFGVASPGAAQPAPSLLPYQPPRAPVASAPAGPADAAMPPAGVALWPFPAIGAALEFPGEGGRLAWPVYLTAEQLRAPLRLRAGFGTAISVRPDTSTLTAEVNGVAVGRVAIDAATGEAAPEFEIPAHLLRTGFNLVALVAAQSHRVDCSAAATFELWTRLDPAATGLVLPAATPGPASLADLPALRPRADGALRISLLMPGRMAPELAERAIRAVQLVALAAGTLYPVVEVVGAGAAADGVVLALGTDADLASLPGASGSRPGGGPVLVPAPSGRAPLLVLAGSTLADVDTALSALAETARRAGTAEGRRGTPEAVRLLAALHGRVAEIPPVRVGLAAGAGLAAGGDVTFPGRRGTAVVDLVLPSDVLPADYARAVLVLHGRIAPEVGPGARLHVDLNGRHSIAAPLPRGRGRDGALGEVSLPLGLFRPGINRLSLSAELPTAADATCDPTVRPTRDARMTLDAGSGIELPALARVLRVPELAQVATGALPLARPGTSPVLHLPRPDRGSMEAALTFAARAAVAAGAEIPFRFSLVPPRPGEVAVTVAPADAVPAAALRDVGLDPVALNAAWSAGPSRGAPDAACRSPAEPSGVEEGAPLAARDVPPAAGPTILRRLAEAAAPPVAIRDGRLRRVAFVPDTAMVVAQSERDPAGGSRILVMGRTGAAMAAAMQCLSAPERWSQLRGRIATIGSSGDVAAGGDAALVTFAGPQDWSPGHLRRLIAGWFALNPLAYLGAVVVAAGWLGAATLGVVLRSGRPQP